MGYLNSVLSSSSQVHAEDAPVSGGGLRLIFFGFDYGFLLNLMFSHWSLCVFDGFAIFIYYYYYFFVLFVMNYESLVHVLCDVVIVSCDLFIVVD